MNAVGYYQNDESPKRLLPQDPVGQRFLQYFHHGWGFIQAPMPERGERPDWRTQNRYPLEPRNLWSQYLDKEMLLGLSFGQDTRYLLLDIDRKGANHPENNQEHYDGIQGVLEEEIGLCRPVPLLSSDSDGIHLYYFLPSEVHSFSLAVAAKQALVKAGYAVRNGQLEIFPNTKPYGVGKPTSFRAHRLPLQERSFLLDWDLQPISNSVETFLDWADWSASGQDMETLIAAMVRGEEWYKKQYSWRGGKTSAEQFCFDLEEAIAQGWTGYGQTNSLLLTFAKYGIIFLALERERLRDYMLETSINAPGYRQWCRHQHEIEKRVREVARSAENYPYYPYPGKPPRKKTYKEHFGGGGESNIILFPQQKMHEDTLERITAVVAMLKAEDTFPSTAYQRIQAIIAKSTAAFGVGVSQTTLYKPEYRSLWHPAHENTQTGDGVNPDAAVEKYPILPDPWEGVVTDLKPLVVEASSSLHHPPYYEGFFLPPAKAGGEIVESAAFNINDQPQAGLVSEDGSFQNPLQKRISFDSTVNDKHFLYPPVPAAQPKKSENSDKQTLSIPEVLTETGVSYQDTGASLPNPLIDSNVDIRSDIPAVSTSLSIPVSTPPDIPPPVTVNPEPHVLLHAPNGGGTLDANIFSTGDSPPVVSFPSPHEAAEGEVNKPVSSDPTYTPEQHREAIHFRLQALAKAKHQVRVFCHMEGIALMPAQREQLSQFVRHRLMLASPSPILQQEAQEWFAAHEDITAQIESFGVFWEYFQNLQ
jgi:hypothetical protein